MLKNHKQLMNKVSILSREKYDYEGKRLTMKGNLFRLVWIIWIIFWGIELIFNV
jgi:hypothetical protein